MEIRSATPDDASAIAAVHAWTWQVAYRDQIPAEVLERQTASGPLQRRAQRWREGIENGRVDDHVGPWEVKVAVMDGDVVGFVAAGPDRQAPPDAAVGEIYAIYVDPERWGEGAGRRLLDAAVADLQERGMSRAQLWVLATNERAQRFYGRHGWEATGESQTDELAGTEVLELRYARSL